MQCGSDGQLYMEKEELELENKPEGGEKEKQAPEQKPAMTYAEFKAQKGRKRGKNRGTGMNKDLAVKIAAVCGGVVVLVGAVGGGSTRMNPQNTRHVFCPEPSLTAWM